MIRVRRSPVLARKLLPILRIPAGDTDGLDPEAILDEEGNGIIAETGEDLVQE